MEEEITCLDKGEAGGQPTDPWKKENKDPVIIPVVIKPGSIARNDDVVGLLSHIVLMQVWILGLLPLVPRTAFILIL